LTLTKQPSFILKGIQNWYQIQVFNLDSRSKERNKKKDAAKNSFLHLPRNEVSNKKQ
jgi:hypothetical protein